jgi:Ni/Co efflux regulator RcnB
MRRIAIIAAAALVAVGAFASGADAQGRGRGHGGDGGRGGGRGGYERGYDRGDRGDRGGRGYGRGGREDRGPRFTPRGRGGSRGAPPPYYAEPRRSWRQGERLPPMYRGERLPDPGRYRLRQAPPGYDWVGVGPDIYLVQRSTGMVLDTIPGGN